MSHSAFQEASGYGTAALELVSQFPDESVRVPLELKCLLTQTKTSMFAQGLAAPETTKYLHEARRLINDGVGDDTQRLDLLHSLTIVDYIEARMGSALQGGRAFLALAERQHDPVYRVAGEIHVGTVLLLMGELREALSHFERAAAGQAMMQHGWGTYHFVWEPPIALLCMKHWTLLALGRHRDARPLPTGLTSSWPPINVLTRSPTHAISERCYPPRCSATARPASGKVPES